MSQYNDNYGRNIELIKERIRTNEADSALQFNSIYTREFIGGVTNVIVVQVLKRCSFLATWNFYWNTGGAAIPATNINVAGSIADLTTPLFAPMFADVWVTPIIDQRTLFQIPSGGFSPFLDPGTVVEIQISHANMGANLYMLNPTFQVIMG